jgi:hypothetical protein
VYGIHRKKHKKVVFSERTFSSLWAHSECLSVFFGKMSQHMFWLYRITDEGWNYPKSRSGSLTGQRANFVAILFLALAVRFNIGVNICHLLSYYFLELLQIFVDFKKSVLPTLIKIKS